MDGSIGLVHYSVPPPFDPDGRFQEKDISELYLDSEQDVVEGRVIAEDALLILESLG